MPPPRTYYNHERIKRRVVHYLTRVDPFMSIRELQRRMTHDDKMEVMSYSGLWRLVQAIKQECISQITAPNATTLTCV